MGGAVMLVPRTPAEHTALLLQEAARGGSPVMIPGEWDHRPLARALQVTRSPDPQATVAAQASVVSGRERLARELEGGGAPSQRRRGQRSSVLARLWRSALHPKEIAIIWSRALPQAR